MIDEATLLISTSNAGYNNIILYLTLYFFITILSNFFGFVSNYIKKISAEELNKNISALVLDKICELDVIQFDNSKIYDDIQKVNEESGSRFMSFLGTTTEFVKNIISLVGNITIFMTFSPAIIILCLICTIPTFFINFKLTSKEFTLYNKRFEDKRLALYLKSICIKNENIKEMKILGIGKYFKKIIVDIYEKYINEDKLIRKDFLKILTLADILESTPIYILNIYTLIIGIKQKLTIGNITMYISTIESFKYSINSILMGVIDIYEEKLYIESLLSLLELKPISNKLDEKRKREFNKEFKNIEFKNVWFKYPGAIDFALKNINIRIEKGKSYALVGMNGSGKTTLIKLLSMLYLPTEGDIYIDSVNIKEFNKESIYKNIGVIFQDFLRYPLDVAKNIGIGNIANIENINMIKNMAVKSGANEFVENLPRKYNTQLQKEWTEGVDLSLGEWQKLAISRAFMADSSILILDEPTASLDAVAECEIFKTFKDMIDGKTSILIAHRFSTVKLADKIFVIKDGVIIEEGSHEELIEINGLYENLYSIQAEVYN